MYDAQGLNQANKTEEEQAFDKKKKNTKQEVNDMVKKET